MSLNLKATTKTFDLGDGREITLETGKLARQAHGSALVKLGDTVLMATVVSSKEAKEGQDFFPLTVEYQEKYSSSGRIPGGFLKREGRLGDHEILTCRLVDRAIRPLFPDGYMFDTQIMISLISSDNEQIPDALACLAASTAISVSDIPFNGPISEVRVARVDGNFICNPTFSQLENADLDIIVGATAADVCMVEGEMKECSEEELVAAIEFGHAAIKIQIKAQEELAELFGATEKRSFVAPEVNEELKAKVEAFASERVLKVASSALGKSERKEQFKAIKNDFIATLSEEEADEHAKEISEFFASTEKKVIRNMILDTRKRLDGRELTQIRPLHLEVDFLPRAHGSALFTRGETQSLTTATFGNKMDEKMIDTVNEKAFKDFYLHYNFPAFCTGETKPNRGPSRREVGHGNLAERSLKQVIPGKEINPYTVRVVSDILESNGSSSMATVCAGSMALMDAGVKIPNHVSGIAMGMISDPESGNTAILTDILGDEDHLGDMDFKVTGTRNGICACQMDMKIEGLSNDLLKKALQQAKDARLSLLDAMYGCIEAPRTELKPYVPRMEVVKIAKEFIGAVIGPGGKVIQEMQATTNTDITVEEVENEGIVTVMSSNKEDLDKAIGMIKGIVAVPEVGDVYDSVVKSIMPYGAFVEFLPGKQGLVHISELAWERVEKVEDVLKQDQNIKVKLIGVDQRSGKFKLSHKVLLPKPVKEES